MFYARLLYVATILKPKTMLFEVAGLEQGIRVVQMAQSAWLRNGLQNKNPILIEIWRDSPSPDVEHFRVGKDHVAIRGTGQGRSVYITAGSVSENSD